MAYGNSVGRIGQVQGGKHKSLKFPFSLYVAAAALVLSNVPFCQAAAIPPQAKAKGKPQAVVAAAVSAYFGRLPDHRPGDLIRRSDLAGVIDLIGKTGMDTSRFAGLAELIPADSSEIQRLNSSRQGKAFLRKVAATKGGYQGVEDLSERPDGRRHLRELSRSKGGEKMIEYMVSTSGGANLMKMAPRGGGERLPQPRIYTAPQLQQQMIKLLRQEAGGNPGK